jgi:hypothetical protein
VLPKKRQLKLLLRHFTIATMILHPLTECLEKSDVKKIKTKQQKRVRVWRRRWEGE